MKSVASALVLVASAADLAVPVLVAPAVVLAASTAARAEQPAQSVRQQVVSYRDLNLASASGMATFQARVKGAVENVCSPQSDLRSLGEAADYKACVAKASRDAMSALPQARQQAARPSHEG